MLATSFPPFLAIQLLQAKQRFERLARAQGVRIDGAQRIEGRRGERAAPCRGRRDTTAAARPAARWSCAARRARAPVRSDSAVPAAMTNSGCRRVPRPASRSSDWRALLDAMQEHQRVAVLDRLHVNVGHARGFAGKAGELEVVRGEQREGADLAAMNAAQAQASDRPSKVLVPRPTSSISTRLRVGGVVQDVGRFGHLQHEGRAAARQIVGGADAGENAIERPERPRASRARNSRYARGWRSARSGACRCSCRPCSGR